jgi:hypothetical protein
MDCPKPEDSKPVQELAGRSGESTDKAQTTSTGANAPAKFLQLMALWLEGAGQSVKDGEGDGSLSGWSARYAANFDCEAEIAPLDLAPVLGLPQGTSREELFRIADEQEEELIRQLTS